MNSLTLDPISRLVQLTASLRQLSSFNYAEWATIAVKGPHVWHMLFPRCKRNQNLIKFSRKRLINQLNTHPNLCISFKDALAVFKVIKTALGSKKVYRYSAPRVYRNLWDRSPTTFCQQLSGSEFPRVCPRWRSASSLSGIITECIFSSDSEMRNYMHRKKKKCIFFYTFFSGNICYARGYALWKMKGYFVIIIIFFLSHFVHFSCLIYSSHFEYPWAA